VSTSIRALAAQAYRDTQATGGAMEIRLEEYQNGGAFVVWEGNEKLGEQTFRRVGDVLYIDHTEVDERLRGQGVARSLVDTAVAYARANHALIVPLCPYTRSQFEKDPSIGDVLKELPPKRPR
jgi:predicted GNAT family acetyltransferase